MQDDVSDAMMITPGLPMVRLILAAVALLVNLLATPSAFTICHLNFIGSGKVTSPSELRPITGNCNCRQLTTVRDKISILYPYGNSDLAALCSTAGGRAGIGAAVPFTPWRAAAAPDGTGLIFRGPAGDLIVDGAPEVPPSNPAVAPAAPTAAYLDLQSNGPALPLLTYSGLHNVTLRNLVFRNLTTRGAPLVLLENCTNVVLQNVTIEDVRVDADTRISGSITSIATLAGLGGGVAALGLPHALVVINSRNVSASGLAVRSFRGTFSGVPSAAVYIQSSSGVRVSGMICRNSRSGGGPCLTVASSDVALASSTFTGNRASAVGGSSGAVGGSSAGSASSGTGGGGAGGAIYLSGAPAAAAGRGGFQTATSLAIVDSAFEDNSAVEGGAMATGPNPDAGGGAPPTSLTVQGSTFRNNVGDHHGGDISVSAGTSLKITGSSFVGSSTAAAWACSGSGSSTSTSSTSSGVGSIGSSSGGCVYVRGSRVAITTSNFTRCSSQGPGGALFHEPAAADCPTPGSCSLVLERCRFERNSASHGGALLVLLPNDTRVPLNLTGCTFKGNKATRRGGAVAAPGGDLCSRDSRPDWPNGAALEEAAAPAEESSPAGAAPLAALSPSGAGDAVLATLIQDCRFEGNRAPLGAGLYATYNSAQGVVITGSRFVANDGTDGAGAYIRAVPYAEVVDSLFDRNTATVSSGLALHSLLSYAALRNTSFRNNVAGGMDYSNVGSTLLLSDPDKVYVGPEPKKTLPDILLFHCTFRNNTGGGDGAGALLSTCRATLKDVVFEENRSSGNGAGLALIRTAVDEQPSPAAASVPRAALDRVQFKSNDASAYGGGLYAGAGWEVEVSDSSFVGNSAGSSGALYATTCPNPIVLRRVGFHSNTAYLSGAVGLDLCSSRFYDVVFRDNTATGTDGGAINVAPLFDPTLKPEGVTLEFWNTTFEGNAAAMAGGAVEVKFATVTLVNATFNGNSAGDQGGALHLSVESPGFNCSVQGARFLNNTAATQGGGLYAQGWRLGLEDVVFANNTATGNFYSPQGVAGGLYLSQCPTTTSMRNLVLDGNTAALGGAAAFYACRVSLRNATFTRNVAESDGGAAVISCATGSDCLALRATITNATFDSNRSPLGSGGALLLSINTTIQDALFANNDASREGGSIQAETHGYTAPKITLRTVRFENNSAGLRGGALAALSCHLDALNVSWVNNSVSTAKGAAEGDCQGGALAIATAPSTVALRQVTFRGNQAYKGAALLVQECDLNLQHALMEGNKAGADGGALLARGLPYGALPSDSPSYSLTVLDTSFDGNNASTGSGGAIQANWMTVTLSHSNFTANGASSEGGAVFLEPSGSSNQAPHCSARSVNFAGNRASSRGGALSSSGWSLELLDASFSANSVSTEEASGGGNAGGGAFLLSSTGTVIAQRVVFRGNTAFQAGAVYLERVMLELDNATFEGNLAAGNAGALQAIGKQQFRGGSSGQPLYGVRARHVTFARNTAGGQGGAIRAYQVHLNVTGASFQNNTAAQDGGAVCLQAVPPSTAPQPTTTNTNAGNTRALFSACTFTSNYASNNGGGMYLVGSAVRLEDSDLYDNGAVQGGADGSWSSAGMAAGVSNAGGAIFATSCPAPLELRRTRLGSNRAEGRGGAVALVTCAAGLEDVEVVGNEASMSGGGVAAGHQPTLLQPQGPAITLTRCNFTRNAAKTENGGALLAVSVPLSLNGCHLTGNSASMAGGGVHSSGSPHVAVSTSTLTGNQAGPTGGALYVDNAGMVQVTDSVLSNNTATDSAGGLALLNPACAFLQNLTVDGNSASTAGASLVTMPSATSTATPQLAGGEIGSRTSCVAAIEGHLGPDWVKRYLSPEALRVVGLQGSSLGVVASGVIARGNRALSGPGGVLLLQTTRGSILLDGFEAYGNSAAGDGGVVSLQDSRTEDVTLYVTSGMMYGNGAAGLGGVFALDGSRTHQQAAIFNTAMRRNTASAGGALALKGNASVALHGCSLENNTASGVPSVAAGGGLGAAASSSGGGGGGGVYATSCRWLIVNQTAITASVAQNGYGGGLFAANCAAVVISRSTVWSNRAAGSGGGAYLAASAAASAEEPSVVLITNSDVSGNSAGAGDASGSSPTSSSTSSPPSSTLLASGGSGSLLAGSGGGLLLGGAVSALVHQTALSHNTAELMGGAAAVDLQCSTGATSTTGGTAAGQGALQLRPAWALAPGLCDLAHDFNLTLQALARAGSHSGETGCWSALLHGVNFWNNVAGDSGGGIYATSLRTLTLFCGDPLLNDSTANDPELAELVDDVVAATAAAPAAPSGSTSVLPIPVEALQRCSQPLLVGAAAGSPPDAGRGHEDQGGVRSNVALRGFGADLATTPSQLVLSSLTEAEQTQALSNSDFSANAGNVSTPGGMLLYGRLLMESSGTPSAAVAVASGPPAAAGGGSSAASVSAAPPPWLRRALLYSRGGGAVEQCAPGQDCRLELPTNVPVTLRVSLYDALNQLANDNSSVRPAVRATVQATTAWSRADLLGSAFAQVSGGQASLEALRVRARKGQYLLQLQLESSSASSAQQVPPLQLNLTVPPCALGEVSLDGGYLCSRCSPNTYSMDVDPYDMFDQQENSGEGGNGGGTAASNNNTNIGTTNTSSYGRCSPCPDNAKCPGGAVVVPRQGYWHSAANSTTIHECPNPAACRDGDDAANADLLRCQERWYAYFGVPSRMRALMQADDGGATIVGAYLDVYLRALASGGSPPDAAGAGLTTPLLPPAGSSFDGFLLDCALWGLPANHTASYMQRQCAPGYSGNLCATCTPYHGEPYAFQTDFTCCHCFSKPVTVLIGVGIFVANTIWLGFSVLMTFLADYRIWVTAMEEEAELASADLLKVLIVHYQFFNIVTRISLDWPKSVTGLQSAVSSVIGSVKQAYSPSCLWPGADSASQATVQVLAGLLLPLASVLLVLGLWVLRYMYWNQRLSWNVFGRPTLRRSDRAVSRTRDGPTSDHSVTAPDSPGACPHPPSMSTASCPYPQSAQCTRDASVWNMKINDTRAASAIAGGDSAFSWPKRSASSSVGPRPAGAPPGQPAKPPQCPQPAHFSSPPAAFVAVALEGPPMAPTMPETTTSTCGTSSPSPDSCGTPTLMDPRMEPYLSTPSPAAAASSFGGGSGEEHCGPASKRAAGHPNAPCRDPVPAGAEQQRGVEVAVAVKVEDAPPYAETEGRTGPETPVIPGRSSAGCHRQPPRGGARRPADTPPGGYQVSRLNPVFVGLGTLPAKGDPHAESAPAEAQPRGPEGSSHCPGEQVAQNGESRASPPTPRRPSQAPVLLQQHQEQLRQLQERQQRHVRHRHGPDGDGGAAGECPQDRGSLGGAGAEAEAERSNSVPSTVGWQPGPEEHASVSSEGQGFAIFKHRESLSTIDAKMNLGRQLFLVLMVTSFVLMPTWATEALSIFSCYRLDDGRSGEYPENQRATWKYGYWVRDMNAECYTGRHLAVWVPVGIVAFVALCLAMPLICAGLLYTHRDRLRQLEVVQAYGFLYHSYKPRYYFWESLAQAQTLLLVVVEVFGRTMWVFHQALLMLVLVLVILMLNTYFSPLVQTKLTSLQLLSLGTICLTLALGMFTSGADGVISQAGQTALGVLILVINCGVIVAFLTLILRQAAPTLQREATRWFSRVRTSSSRISSWLGLPRVMTRITSPTRWRLPTAFSSLGRQQHADGPVGARQQGVDGAPGSGSIRVEEAELGLVLGDGGACSDRGGPGAGEAEAAGKAGLSARETLTAAEGSVDDGGWVGGDEDEVGRRSPDKGVGPASGCGEMASSVS